MRLLTLILIVMSTIANAQEWLDTDLYPFENNYIQLEAGKMHYVDEGKGEVILFVHGTPSWSFLYREFIAELSNTHRCIAIDHIGFGLSEKPARFDGTPESHSKNLSEFIQKCNLENITLVVHDFGGPIGLGSAIQNPDRIKQIALFNTWLWETKSNPSAQKVDKIINSKMGRFMYLNMNMSPKVLLKKGFYERSKLTKKIHKQYIKPFPDKSSRLALLNIGKSLVASSDWFAEQWENLYKIEDKPWIILWGTKDAFITPEYLEKWKLRLPNAELKTFECGHFVQEEKPQESIQALNLFLNPD